MEKVLKEFSVKYLQILDENGKCDEKLMPKLTSSEIKNMYESMILARVFDDKAIKLQRQGRLGTYASSKGQEASHLGPGFALKKEDFIIPSFRESGLFMQKGVPAELVYAFWAGDERGMQIPNKINMLPISIPVGTQSLHAVGLAMAFQYQNKNNVSLGIFGDGGTSEGDFNEAMNFAGVFNAPVILLCQNNQWAISFPVKKQTAAETIAQKAIAFGFSGVVVDGNDIFAMYKATKDAADKARKGLGPTLIEALTYRMSDHTTSDDAKKYRSEKEVKEWEKKDPILRLQKYMINKKIANKNYFQKILKNSKKIIDKAVENMEAAKPYPPEDIFNYMFAEKTLNLIEQQSKFVHENKEGGK
jgi:pyruvate dehydrogenase E1 component alpha subunit